MEKIILNNFTEEDFRVNEAYNSLRTNLMFCGSDIKTVAFTSCIPNEGKSTVSFQTAVAMAYSERKVLYIDADIRKSVFLKSHGATGKYKGLTHYLAGQAELDKVIHDTNVEGLHVITIGQGVANPSELLSDQRFAQLLDGVRNQYDYIFIDCPPLGSVIDAAIVAQHCDGSVLVVQAGKISAKMAQRVKQQLQKSGSKILGVVLSKVDISGHGFYGKYYGKYYGNYYGKEKK